MNQPTLSAKGLQLIALYERMAKEGYTRTDQRRVEVAYSDFELKPYREALRGYFQKFGITSALDYGSGGCDWTAAGFDDSTNQSAQQYFQLQTTYRYEPARQVDERQPVDCVISFDVLEHIFITDVPTILRDMFSYAGKLLILNVACYRASALLPNGENAHVTVRPPLWWKGMLDAISIEYPDTSVLLICSKGWRNSEAFPLWKANDWQTSSTFEVKI